MKVIFATHNANKLREIQQILGHQIELTSLKELSYWDEIPESFDTLEENSKSKAQTIFDEFEIPCFADDTGLEVEALNGAPGVYSARYAGKERDPEKNMNLLLKELEDKENRSAQFRTVITFIDKTGIHQFEGVCPGQIIHSRKGEEGFGYDPLFIPDGSERTFAEMSTDEKNQFSHRARAFDKFRLFISSE